MSFRHVEPGWSVTGLLDLVATADNPPYHALIDTGNSFDLPLRSLQHKLSRTLHSAVCYVQVH